MSVALHGNLKDFGIAEVFQLIGQQRKTGLLEITGADYRVQLAFDEGAVVWAAPVGPSEFAVLGDRLVRCGLITRPRLEELMRESQTSARALPTVLVESEAVRESDLEEISDLLSRETIFEVMRWTGGSFHFTAQAIRHNLSPEKLLPAEQILMDGLRMLDEWQTFRDLVPDENTIFKPVGRIEVYRQKVGASSRHTAASVDRIFQLVDGRLSARRIIDLSRLGTFDATRILAELHQGGLIAPLEASAVRKLDRTRKRKRPVAKTIRWGFAASLPLALLALLVMVGLRDRPVRIDLQGKPVARRPLEQVRERFAVRRLRNAIEAERYINGDWPDSIDGILEAESAGDFTMASDPARPYYYAKRGDGVLLLAPRR